VHPGIFDPFELQQCIGRRLKQEVEHHLSVAHYNGIELMGQGENHMIILHRKQLPGTRFNPFFFFGAATMGTVPVATTVIAVLHSATRSICTSVGMIT
jgi:hypothetical protein